MAIGAIHELKTAGLRVPEDISVVGFDDIGFSEVFDPPITTIRQPRHEMGRLAMDMVVRRLEGDVPPEDAILPFELIERASVARAREP